MTLVGSVTFVFPTKAVVMTVINKMAICSSIFLSIHQNYKKRTALIGVFQRQYQIVRLSHQEILEVELKMVPYHPHVFWLF